MSGFTAVHNERLEGLAEEHGITLGKAMLINKVLDSIPYYSFDGLEYLNINELNALLDPKLADVTVVSPPVKAFRAELRGSLRKRCHACHKLEYKLQHCKQPP